MSYNGHESWEHWNVSLWINNDEGMYRMVLSMAGRFSTAYRAAEEVLETFKEFGWDKTPDGAEYTLETLEPILAEMMEEMEDK